MTFTRDKLGRYLSDNYRIFKNDNWWYVYKRVGSFNYYLGMHKTLTEAKTCAEKDNK